VEVVFALDAEAEPFGLGGFEDEAIEEGTFFGVLVAGEPGLEESSQSASTSLDMMRVVAHMPWRVALRAEVWRPVSLVGPVRPQFRFSVSSW